MTRPKPWQAGHAPSGELNANSGGVGSRNSRPQRGQCSPRRNVADVRSSIRDFERAGQGRTRSRPPRRSRGATASPTTKRPTTMRQHAPRRRAAARPLRRSRRSPPPGESARKKPARLNSAMRAASLAARLRFRAAPGAADGSRPGHRRHERRARAPPRPRRAPRPRGPRRPARPRRRSRGRTSCPPWAKSSRRESWISVCVPTVERALRTPFFCSRAMAGGTGSIESASGRSRRSGTGGRRSRATPRIAAALRRRACRRRGDDLPEPETPVTTVSRPIGMSTETFLRLWVRAPPGCG